jgi:hypothetical protein
MYVDLSKLLEEPSWSVEDDIKQSLSYNGLIWGPNTE